MAITHISKEMWLKRFQLNDVPPEFKATDELPPMDSRNLVVLSLGTGVSRNEERVLSPLMDIFRGASSDIVDINVSTMFETSNSHGYIRIQVIN